MLAISLENTEKITLEEIGENLANLKAELVRLRKEDEKQKTELQEQKAEVASMASWAGLPLCLTLPLLPVPWLSSPIHYFG